jgi:hypothetical protein
MQRRCGVRGLERQLTIFWERQAFCRGVAKCARRDFTHGTCRCATLFTRTAQPTETWSCREFPRRTFLALRHLSRECCELRRFAARPAGISFFTEAAAKRNWNSRSRTEPLILRIVLSDMHRRCFDSRCPICAIQELMTRGPGFARICFKEC